MPEPKENQGTIAKLKVVLASNVALYLKSLFCHWNIIGPDFPQYHLLLDAQYKELQEQTDEIAEKIRRLDAMAPASFQRYQELSIVKDMLQNHPPIGMLTELLEDHERMRVLLKETYDIAEQEGNHDVSNYMAERMDGHAKMAWMLRTTIRKVPA
jgi:starvation-inducible DNA-binding protein